MVPNDRPMLPPRRPWLAGLGNFFYPGLGLLYAGAPLHALLWFLCVCGLGFSAVAVALWLPVKPLNEILFFATLFGMLVGGWFVGWRAAKRAPTPFLGGPLNRGWIYLAYAVLTAIAGTFYVNSFLRSRVQAFRTPSSSMDPTLLIGDFFLVEKTDRTPRRGAPVVFESVEEPGLVVIKRQVAVAGDTVSMSAGTLVVNHQPLPQAVVMQSDATADADTISQRALQELRDKFAPADTATWTLSSWGPLIVPPETFFALGDNRNQSYDSRYYGPVPTSHVIGRPRMIYLSVDSTGIRWHRLGQVIN